MDKTLPLVAQRRPVSAPLGWQGAPLASRLGCGATRIVDGWAVVGCAAWLTWKGLNLSRRLAQPNFLDELVVAGCAVWLQGRACTRQEDWPGQILLTGGRCWLRCLARGKGLNSSRRLAQPNFLDELAVAGCAAWPQGRACTRQEDWPSPSSLTGVCVGEGEAGCAVWLAGKGLSSSRRLPHPNVLDELAVAGCAVWLQGKACTRQKDWPSPISLTVGGGWLRCLARLKGA